MNDESSFPADLRRELERLEALEVGIQRGLRWEEMTGGRWKVSCETAFRWDFPDRILADLDRLSDGAGWTTTWDALFSWPESPY